MPALAIANLHSPWQTRRSRSEPLDGRLSSFLISTLLIQIAAENAGPHRRVVIHMLGETSRRTCLITWQCLISLYIPIFLFSFHFVLHSLREAFERYLPKKWHNFPFKTFSFGKPGKSPGVYTRDSLRLKFERVLLDNCELELPSIIIPIYCVCRM